MRIGKSQSDCDPVSSVTASELQSGPQAPGKQREARPLGRAPHLWAENPGCLPSKPPWDCWPSAEQQSICFFADAEENPPCVTCCPWDLRCLRERQLWLQNCFLNSTSCLGAQPTQGNHLILLLTAALAAVSLPPKCLITVNAPLPVPTATSSAQASWPGASAVSLGCPHQLGPLLSLLFHYRFCRCVSHRTHICPQPWMGSTAEPKPQPIHGALGGFLWSQVSFLISQHSGWLCWPWALCSVHLGPHTSDRAVPAPGPLAPLVLTTYCPPSKHSCNIPFPSARVSRAFIW